MAAGKDSTLDFCVLIPCFNNTEGLRKSLYSIRYPTGKFLVVVVDDGSTKPVSLQDLQGSGISIPVHVIRLEKNSGITTALNAGLQWIVANTKALYIARLDCGDVCHENRFLKQVELLNTNPAVGLVGSWCLFKENSGPKIFAYKAPQHDAEIRKAMHFQNVFIHPAIMFRTQLLAKTGFYPFQYPYAEDYALCWMLLQHSKGAILPEYLTTCVLNTTGISAKNRKQQLKSCQQIISRFAIKNTWKLGGIAMMQLRFLLPQQLALTLKLFKKRA